MTAQLVELFTGVHRCSPVSLAPAPIPSTPPQELPLQPPSLSSWLQAQQQAGNITADREQLLLSLAAAVKTLTGTR